MSRRAGHIEVPPPFFRTQFSTWKQVHPDEPPVGSAMFRLWRSNLRTDFVLVRNEGGRAVGDSSPPDGCGRNAKRLGQGASRVCPNALAAPTCHDLPVSLTVLIVDDHSGFRTFARALLEVDGFHVVGEAEDAASALAAASRLHPQVVVLDIQLPDLDGFEVAERLARADDPPAVVLVSTRGLSSYRRRLAGSSVRGFIPKSDLSGSALSALVS
jgi:CheY-like chemotaxis protein